MAYFPFFVDLEGMPGLIAGGGHVALRKIEKLRDYGPRLTVVSPEVLPQIREFPDIRILERAFCPEDLEGIGFVIAATDDYDCNCWISRLCRERHIPINAVDEKENCTFLFPALVKCGLLSIGISTGGASPSAAAWVRETIAEVLPQDLPEILAFLEQERAEIKARYHKDPACGAVFQAMWRECLMKGRALTPQELESFHREREEIP